MGREVVGFLRPFRAWGLVDGIPGAMPRAIARQGFALQFPGHCTGERRRRGKEIAARHKPSGGIAPGSAEGAERK